MSALTVEDVNVIKRALEEDLKSASKWFETNKFHLNVNKTKWSLLGTRQRLGLGVFPNFLNDRNGTEHVNEYNYLGVYSDVSLNVNYHIKYMANKMPQRCGVLKRVRMHLTRETSQMPHNSLALFLFYFHK